MTKEQFIQQLEKTYHDGVELVKIKNADYAKGDDPFSNFRSAGFVGVEVERAILIRVLDKMSRVSNLLNKEAKVKEESISDNCIDIINYMAILKIYLENRHENG